MTPADGAGVLFFSSSNLIVSGVADLAQIEAPANAMRGRLMAVLLRLLSR